MNSHQSPAENTINTRRRFGGLIVCACATLLIWLVVAPPDKPAINSVKKTAAFLPIDFWDWGAGRILDHKELSALDEFGCEYVYSLCGFIRALSPNPLWEPEGRPSLPLPGRKQMLVVRIDAALAKNLDAADSKTTDQLFSLILAGFERNRTAQTIGLQIDCDIPTKRLAHYVEFLRLLRAQLAPELRLSITMLIDWVHSPLLSDLMHTVDEVAPQFYNTYLPIDPHGPIPLLYGQELETVVKKLEAVARPYRLGLPTYEQCSLYAVDGSLIKPAIAVSPEQALSAGGQVVFAQQKLENILSLRFPADTTIGRDTFKKGQSMAFASATPNGLAYKLSLLQKINPQHCLGILLFRLPGNERTHTLSIAQVLAAASDAVRPAWITARLEHHGNHHYALFIRNNGDSDFIDFTHPVRIVLHAPECHINPELLPNNGFTSAKTFSAQESVDKTTAELPRTTHDSFELFIGLLRAGEGLIIEDISITHPNRGLVKPRGQIQRGNYRENF
jgi:Protein of unknown function (DUF3142)